jgi:hypothetical protein
MTRTARRSFLLLWGLLAGCGSEDKPTSVLVRVESDLNVGSELTEVRIQIFDRAGGNELSSRSIALTATEGLPAQFTLPASFALVPSERDVTDFRLVLTGRGPLGGGAVMDVIERQAIGTFVPHEQVLLPMMLSRSCLGVLCPAAMEPRSDLTCSGGACISAVASPENVSQSAAVPASRESRVSLVQPVLESRDERP